MTEVGRRFDTGATVTAQEVAEAEGISIPYAQKLLRMLSRAGLIDSQRGVNGGYVLARHPGRITVGEIVRALDGGFETADVCDKHTGGHETCARAGDCTIRPVWSFIEDFVNRTLDGLTLDVLLGGTNAVSTHLHELAATSSDDLHCPVVEIVPTTTEH